MNFIPKPKRKKIVNKLEILYPNDFEWLTEKIDQFLAKFWEENKKNLRKKKPENNIGVKYSYKDIILNTYPNSIQKENESPLQTLCQFSEDFFRKALNGVHVLPFCQWDTDRGFSILDYYKVDPRYGIWTDFMSLTSVFEILMVDLVINHASIDNPIVQKALIGATEFKDFVITFDDKNKPSDDDLLKVIRARPTPVLTKYFIIRKPDKSLVATFNFPSSAHKNQIIKTGWVWTTFSRPINLDGTVTTRQVDFNFQNPYVFLKFVEIIFFYFQHGASWIRLDAIGYLWKKIGLSCLHLPETHLVIQTLAEIINIFSDLSIVLIGEINEPQDKALPYLGKEDILESDMIYLFTHFPLAVHAVLTGTSEYYMKWLPSLQSARGRLFISVLGTHDGMGMKPIGDYLPEEEKSRLQKILLTHGALPNYSRLPGGEKIIYELCSTPWNFINPKNTDEPFSIQLNRYLIILILGLMIKGVPSIYINGLLGIPNSSKDLDENRSINRQILKGTDLQVQLSDHSSRTFQIFHRITKILRIRASESAFDPHGSFTPIIIDNHTISLITQSKDKLNCILGIVNISPHNRMIEVPLSAKEFFSPGFLIDLIEKTKYQIDEIVNSFNISLAPYQAIWLKKIR